MGGLFCPLKVEAVGKVLDLIKSNTFSEKDLPRIYDVLLSAHPLIEKSPFFSKSYSRNLLVGKSILRPLVLKIGYGEAVYRFLYTPKNSPFLVFKEVAMLEMLCQLLNHTNMPIIYLMRHPCAVVSSIIRGQNKSVMPEGRQKIIENIIAKNSPKLSDKYGNKMDKLSWSQRCALLWLVDVERAFHACQNNQNGLIVIYEKLVEDTLEVTSEMFKHFGLSMTEQTVSFIEESSSSKNSLLMRLKRGEIIKDRYFSVFRNSQKEKNAWKDNMPTSEQKLVMEIVEDSEVFSWVAAQGWWS